MESIKSVRYVALIVLLLGMQELKIRPCPLVFVAFSGGPKACMYKVFQVNFKGQALYIGCWKSYYLSFNCEFRNNVILHVTDYSGYV